MRTCVAPEMRDGLQLDRFARSEVQQLLIESMPVLLFLLARRGGKNFGCAERRGLQRREPDGGVLCKGAWASVRSARSRVIATAADGRRTHRHILPSHPARTAQLWRSETLCRVDRKQARDDLGGGGGRGARDTRGY